MSHTTGRPAGIFDQAFLTDVADVTEVLLIRHAQQEIDPLGPAGDLVNPPLSEQGRMQARLIGEALSTSKIDAVYASPLIRARETAAEIARHHRLEPRVIEDLREVEIFRDIPPDKRVEEFVGEELLRAVRHRMLAERSWDVYPHSEASQAFRKRAINAIEQAIATRRSGRICIVCHGGVINAYTGHIIGTPYDMFFRPAHTSVSIVGAGDGRRVLRLLNDTHHLQTPEGPLVSY